jgi:hypothetical protein
VAGIRGGAGVALPWWGGSPKMLLQTVPVTRFKAGAVGSEMRQGNKTKRPTGTPICEQSQQPGSGRPWSGRYKGPIFFQQEQPTFPRKHPQHPYCITASPSEFPSHDWDEAKMPAAARGFRVGPSLQTPLLQGRGG